jgi:hypothetical protein
MAANFRPSDYYSRPQSAGMRAKEQGNTARWGVVASLALHAFVVGPVLLLRTAPMKPPSDQRVEVQLLTPLEYEVAASSGEVTETAPQATPPPTSPERFADAPAVPRKPLAMAAPAKPELPQSNAMIQPTSMLSEKTLADPRSREARAALATFAGSERIEQLCGIEAMEQIHAWREAFKPDRIVTYAMAGTKLAGETLVAEGAAFRSERKWYNLKFRCGLSRDYARVVAFEFRVEGAVPEAEWQSHNLPPVH